VVILEELKVRKKSEDDESLVFSVEVGGKESGSSHVVTVDRRDLARLTPGDVTAAELVEKSFRFLLEREPKESILSRFNLTTIEDYFPEYEKDIKKRL
jgi:hypothetical protein